MRITAPLSYLRLLSRVNVVDNSEIGRKVKEAGKLVKIIHCYTRGRFPQGGLGDKCLVTILGEMKKGVIVGLRADQKAFIPKFDQNNVVLIDNQNVPLGTRITCPMPNYLRSKGALTARLMAISTKFV